MADRSYRWLLITLAVVGLTVDQTSKYGVFRWLYRGGDYQDKTYCVNREPIVAGWFELNAQYDPETPTCECGASALQTWSAPVMPHVNFGALWGIGGSHKGVANLFFAAVSLIAAGAIAIWGTRRDPSRERWLCTALGLILGGTLGNFYDRIVFGGVRDFLLVHTERVWGEPWPIFNFADCCLVVGATLLLLQAVFATPPVQQPAPSAVAEAGVPAAPKAIVT